MKTLNLSTEKREHRFEASKKLADEAAWKELGECVCLSWRDKARGIESPLMEKNQLHSVMKKMPYFKQYAESRGANLEIDVDHGEYVFLYRPIEGFN